jgi:hypothetical protein
MNPSTFACPNDSTDQPRPFPSHLRVIFEMARAQLRLWGPAYLVLASLAALLAIAILACLSGCATVPDAYIKADRSTYEKVAPDYLKYVADDPALKEREKADRKLVVDLWRVRLESNEKK